MSAAVTTSIAALSGLLGAMLGGLLAGRQQRSAQLRDRMLDVALEYVEVLHAAVPELLEEPQPASQATHAALERACRLSHRAELLFGPDSSVGEQALRAYFSALNAFDHGHQPLEIEKRVKGGESIAREIAQGIWQPIKSRQKRRLGARSIALQPWLGAQYVPEVVIPG